MTALHLRRLVLAVILPAAAAVLGATACKRPPAAPLPRQGSPASGAKTPGPTGGSKLPPGLPTFVDVAPEAGVDVMNHTGKPEQKDWIVSAMGATGVSLDYDSDGDQDLFVVDGTMVTEKGDLVFDDSMRSRLYRNDGGMRMVEVTKESGIDLRAFGMGAASCDYDDDGDPDLYVCCWGGSHLLRNEGNGTFADVTAKAGVGGPERDMATSCCWGDVNGDGIHDLYVATYSDQRKFIDDSLRDGKPPRQSKWRGFTVYTGPSGLDGQLDHLYLGNGDGTFRDVTATNLKDQKPLYGFQPVMSDVDNDGDLDIFVSNDTQENHLWVNGWSGDPQGVFTDKAWHTGVASAQSTALQACMGTDVADFDRDGWLDITVTNFSHDYNTLYLNKTGRSPDPAHPVLNFTDSSHAVDLAQASYNRLSWGVGLWDYDNDGVRDFLAACGHVYGEIANFESTTGTSYKQRCLLMHGSGPTAYKLVDATDAGGPALQMKRVWRGAVFADWDDDGDTDVWVGALNDKAALFRNDGGNRNAFLRLKLVGKGPLKDPSGARVRVTMPGGAKQLLELHHGASFCCDNDPRLLFGCGKDATVPLVEVQWPDGSKQAFKDVATRRAYRVEQGRSELVPDPLAK